MLLSVLSASGAIAADRLEDMTYEQLQQHRLRMQEQNNEVVRQKEEEERKKQDLIRLIREEEERKKALEAPVVLAPVSTSPKTTADLAGDLVTESLKSLMGTGSSSHVDGTGNYVPSSFVQARDRFFKRFK